MNYGYFDDSSKAGERAWAEKELQKLDANLQMHAWDGAEIREIEPYVVCQSTHGPESPRYGASRLPWLSGSATWTYYAVSQYILGIRPEYEGIQLNPSIPSDWKGFTASRLFRGKTLKITVSNPDGVEYGVKSLRVNGQELQGNFIPMELLSSETLVEVVMG